MTKNAGKAILKYALMPAMALALLSISMPAYVPLRWAPSGMRGAWSLSRFPLVFYLNEASSKGLPNLAPGGNPLAAVRAALASWQSVQTAEIQFADLKLARVDSAMEDGTNLITMADTAVNRELLGGDLGAVAMTRISFNASTGEITESDILLNPGCRFSTDLASGSYDLQAVVTHELGHALGCDHSTAQNDTMFFEMAPGEFFQRYLSADAMTFASFTYPNRARSSSLGTIAGRITSAGKGIFGASVTAVNLDQNLIYTALSDQPDGSYAISGLVAGLYAVYAEPLDGPATPDQLLVQGNGAYYKGLNTSFRTTFAVQQSLGMEGSARKLEVNLAVPPGAATLNIDRMGRGDPESGLGYLSAGAVTASPGETLSLWIGGANTWKTSGISDLQILGAGITLDPSRGVKILKNGSGVEVGISVLARVADDAVPGPRTVLVRVGDQQVSSTGGIVITPRSLPATTLYFPYLLTSSVRYTGIALANAEPDTPATVRISARDPAGEMLWDADAIIPADWTLPGGAQAARLERQIFNLPLLSYQSGSVTVESDSSNLQGFFLTGDIDGNLLDGAEAFTRGYRQLYFVDILQNPNTSTEIHLMNIRDIPTVVDLWLGDQNGGTLKGPIKRTIPPGGKIGESVAALFGYSGELHSAHIKAAAADDALAGFCLISHGPSVRPEAIFGLNALPQENAASVLFSPQLAVGDLGLHYETRLNVVNVGEAKTTVTVALLDELGQPLVAATKSADLVPGAHFSLDVRNLFGLNNGQGYIKVTASEGAKLLGNVLFGDGDPTGSRLKFGAALPLFSSGATSFLFAHLAQGMGYYTGVAFLALEDAKVTVEAFAGDGATKGSPARFSLAAGQRLVSLLKGLIPETDGEIGGYVKVTSDKPLIGFELFGTTDGRVLAAVAPQRLLK
jgi:hypothetical protein